MLESTVAAAESLLLSPVADRETAQGGGKENGHVWAWRWDQALRIPLPKGKPVIPPEEAHIDGFQDSGDVDRCNRTGGSSVGHGRGIGPRDTASFPVETVVAIDRGRDCEQEDICRTVAAQETAAVPTDESKITPTSRSKIQSIVKSIITPTPKSLVDATAEATIKPSIVDVAFFKGATDPSTRCEDPEETAGSDSGSCDIFTTVRHRSPGLTETPSQAESRSAKKNNRSFWSPGRAQGRQKEKGGTNERELKKDYLVCSNQADSNPQSPESYSSLCPTTPGKVAGDKAGRRNYGVRRQEKISAGRLMLEILEVRRDQTLSPAAVICDVTNPRGVNKTRRRSTYSDDPVRKAGPQEMVGAKQLQGGDPYGYQVLPNISASDDNAHIKPENERKCTEEEDQLSEDISVGLSVEASGESKDSGAIAQENGSVAKREDDAVASEPREHSATPQSPPRRLSLFLSSLTSSRRVKENAPQQKSEDGLDLTPRGGDYATTKDQTDLRHDTSGPYSQEDESPGEETAEEPAANTMRQAELATTLWGRLCIPIRDFEEGTDGGSPNETPTETTLSIAEAVTENKKERGVLGGLFSTRRGTDNRDKKPTIPSAAKIAPGDLVKLDTQVETVAEEMSTRTKGELANAVNGEVMWEVEGADEEGARASAVCDEKGDPKRRQEVKGRRVMMVDSAWFDLEHPIEHLEHLTKSKRAKRKGTVRLSVGFEY